MAGNRAALQRRAPADPGLREDRDDRDHREHDEGHVRRDRLHRLEDARPAAHDTLIENEIRREHGAHGPHEHGAGRRILGAFGQRMVRYRQQVDDGFDRGVEQFQAQNERNEYDVATT